VALERSPDQEAVARLEDVERHQRAREEDASERKERQQVAHPLNGTLALAW